MTRTNARSIDLCILLTLQSARKIKADAEIALPLLQKAQIEGSAALTPDERLTLIRMIPCNLHNDGKIEGINSLDSSCAGCGFCQSMRQAAQSNPLLICGYCYDAAQESYRIQMKERHILTMAILATVAFTIEELSLIPAGPLVRINSSGDTPNVIYAENMVRFALAHPDSAIGYWAKNIPAVEAAFDHLGKPANVRFIQSSPVIGKPAKRSRYADNLFTVYLTEADVQKALASGANECNGRKCKDCGYSCYLGGWESGTDIAELFRGSKAAVKTISEFVGR